MTLRLRSHETGQIQDRAQIRPNPPCVHTGPFAGRMDDSSYRLNFDLDRKNKIHHYS